MSESKDKGSKDDVDPSIPTKDMLRTMELERLPFEVLADPSIALYSKDDPSDHLSDPSTRHHELGIYIPMQCSVKDRDAHRQTEKRVESILSETHTHTL